MPPLGLRDPKVKEAPTMAKAGSEVYNPRQKDGLIFKRTARETGGELLRLEVFASPNAAPPPDHVRPRQEERFEAVSGILRARVGGEERTLRAGARMVVPPGVSHTWWIGGEEDGRVLVEFLPALNTGFPSTEVEHLGGVGLA